MNTLSSAGLAVALLLSACSGEEGDQAGAGSTDSAAQAEPATDAETASMLTADGLDEIRIGMTRDALVALVGPNANEIGFDETELANCEDYHPPRAPEGVYVMLEQGVLKRISLGSDSTVETAAGLSVGDAAAAVRQAYGDQITAEPHHYEEAPAQYLTIWTGAVDAAPYINDPDARGIRYETNGEGNVSAIHAGGPSIQYVEGCL